jgi:hypothetical protein
MRLSAYKSKGLQGNVHGAMTPQRLTQVGILRAFTRPAFFLSTFLGSRVTQPAVAES